MTRLTYIVNGQEFSSYSQAVAFATETYSHITRRYSPVREKGAPVSEETKAKRLEHIRGEI